MLAMAARGEVREGDWLVADRQTAGRGRLGRRWDSQPGNLFASTLVEVRPDDPSLGGLSLAAGLALLISVGDPAKLKWPNDLMIRGAKVAGVLLERAGDAIVIGFGVNLVSAPTIDGRLTSCVDEDGILSYSRDELLGRLVDWLPWAVRFWREKGTAAMARRWEDEAHLRGEQLAVTLPDNMRLKGTFDGLTDDGALQLRLADGAVRVIHAGDVFLI
jgi:BirA family transcriptional regulator, biotin operon repressor / biotin---[acetyl-CoA-carboxylase] ligase